MSEDEWSDEDWGSDEEDDEYKETPQLLKSISYAVIEPKDIMRLQGLAIEIVSDQLGLTSFQAGALLCRYEWNPSLVVQKVMDGRGVEDVLLSRTKTMIDASSDMLCELCYVDYPSSQLRGLECSHFFCVDCYSGYLEDKVTTAGIECIFTTCPDASCPLIVGEDMFKALLTPSLFNKYRNFVIRSYVERRTFVKWCPSPGCEFAVEYPKARSRIILCKCGFAWCFKCGNDAHQPLTCEALAKWKEKDNSESDNADWLLVNTKACPRCKSPIQKNSGCMHMTCPCHHEFCWLCLGDWTEHGSETGGYYACNRFDSLRDSGALAESEKQRSLADQKLKRYEHYSSRLIEHKNSVRFARTKRDKIKQMIASAIEMMPSINPSVFDVLLESADLVIEARTGLAYSYPLGYFLKSKAKQQFYEFIQGELEHSLELLDKATDLQLTEYIDESETGAVGLSHSFFDVKSSLTSLKTVVQSHFSKSMKEMELGFPDIADTNDRDSQNPDFIDSINESLYWSCPFCTYGNKPESTACEVCQSERPSARR
jgi:ariadne-1